MCFLFWLYFIFFCLVLLSSFARKKEVYEAKRTYPRARVEHEQNNFFVLCFPLFSSLSRAASFSAPSNRAAYKDGNGLHCARCYAVFGYTFSVKEASALLVNLQGATNARVIHASEHAAG